MVGIDVAKEMTEAVHALDCDRLIIDLRGNTGGGIGCLRLMGFLCPDKRPVGYSLSRRGAERSYRPEDLPKFDRIPSEKWELIPVLFRDRSVALVTEGLGRRKFHGKIAILVNEHSASAAEMVAAFAAENRLATLVGAKTAGRLMGLIVVERGRRRIRLKLRFQQRLKSCLRQYPDQDRAMNRANSQAGQTANEYCADYGRRPRIPRNHFHARKDEGHSDSPCQCVRPKPNQGTRRETPQDDGLRKSEDRTGYQSKEDAKEIANQCTGLLH
jgi:hypothetical protein